MKIIIRKVLIPLFMSVLCGIICGRIVYGIYDEKIDNDLKGEKIYLIQAGAYDTYDKMVKNTSIGNYIYYEDDDGLFKSIIGITGNSNNVKKIRDCYGGKVNIDEYYSMDKELNDKIKEYDRIILKTSDKSEIQKVVLETLNIYKNDGKQKILKVSS